MNTAAALMFGLALGLLVALMLRLVALELVVDTLVGVGDGRAD